MAAETEGMGDGQFGAQVPGAVAAGAEEGRAVSDVIDRAVARAQPQSAAALSVFSGIGWLAADEPLDLLFQFAARSDWIALMPSWLVEGTASEGSTVTMVERSRADADALCRHCAVYVWESYDLPAQGQAAVNRLGAAAY